MTSPFNVRQETSFLLYEDNGEREVYVGRTTDMDRARHFYEKSKEADPFGRWGVLIVTERDISWANSATRWEFL